MKTYFKATRSMCTYQWSTHELIEDGSETHCFVDQPNLEKWLAREYQGKRRERMYRDLIAGDSVQSGWVYKMGKGEWWRGSDTMATYSHHWVEIAEVTEVRSLVSAPRKVAA